MRWLHTHTPLLASYPLSRRLGVAVWLKVESLQPSGSFKNRGIGHLFAIHVERGAKGFVSGSGGNAGLAAAYSGRILGVSVRVVIPETAIPVMRRKIAAEGAEVIVAGKDLSESTEIAQEFAKESGWVYVSPYDDPLIWEGNATIIEEVAQEGFVPGSVVLAVGGGGLLCGVMQGLAAQGWDGVPVYACETRGADSLAAALEAGRVVRLERITSIATSIGLKQVADEAFAWTKRHSITSVVVSDQEAVRACTLFAEDHHLLVEPACGAALAPIYQSVELLQQHPPVLVIVCGGSGVSPELLTSWQHAVK